MNYDQMLNTMPPFVHGELPFLNDLKFHKPFVPHWKKDRRPATDELDLTAGVCLADSFPDPEKLLETAFADFRLFVDEAGLAGKRIAITVRVSGETLKKEAYRLEIGTGSVILEASDTEGVRRGLYHLMDRISGSPFLKREKLLREPWLENRISRCFFGPIKRAPFFVDELMNDIDYYPEAYLSRLAREGINGVWITVVFHEVCRTDFLPADPDRERRLAKLRRTVEKCRRYGIKVWTFCLEPLNVSKLGALPEIIEKFNGPSNSFCPNSPEAEKYLYQCSNSLFREVPHLGGIIMCSRGERTTSCVSCLPYYHCFSKKSNLRDIPPKNLCSDRCQLDGARILAKVVNPVYRGIRDASTEGRLIVQFYHPGGAKLHDEVFELVNCLPEGVIFLSNFESSVTISQLGQLRTGSDYWLSVPGPSDRFGRIAEKLRGRLEMAAKLQVCCSHEIATIPFIPVPGILYRKYLQMKRLGLRHVLQCWYFGNYPGVMNHAAGMLAFEDFSSGENSFLHALAESENLQKPDTAASAWKIFGEAYSFYPLSTAFQYYGPMHHGVVWPLYLKQTLTPLQKTWLPDTSPAGDAIGECLNGMTLNEVCVLARQMADRWKTGVEEFEKSGNPGMETTLCHAIGTLFDSGANIMAFYALRRRMLECGQARAGKFLQKMEELVRQEIENSRKMIGFCCEDKRLGYHSESEIFKFFPKKLEWRIRQLETLLSTEFPELRNYLANGGSPEKWIVNTEYTMAAGRKYEAATYDLVLHEDLKTLRIDLNIRKLPGIENETVQIYFCDTLCSEMPYTDLKIVRNPAETKVYDRHTAGEGKFIETDDSWQAELTLPRFVLPEHFRIGFARIYHSGGRMVQDCWPRVNAEAMSARLLLAFFRPDNLSFVHLD